MELLSALGVDLTVIAQFGIFLVTYLVLYFVAFKPYFNAYTQRIENTEGNQETSERVLAEIEELKSVHEEKAKNLNDEFRSIYDEKRNAALKEYDAISFEARKRAKEKLEESRKLIEAEVKKAKDVVAAQIPEVTSQIVVKLLN